MLVLQLKLYLNLLKTKKTFNLFQLIVKATFKFFI